MIWQNRIGGLKLAAAGGSGLATAHRCRQSVAICNQVRSTGIKKRWLFENIADLGYKIKKREIYKKELKTEYKLENNFQEIKKACYDKLDIEFYADKKHTMFQVGQEISTEWKEYPPCFNLEKEFNKIFVDTLVAEGVDQALLRLILVACYFKGSVSYRDRGKTHVSIKFEFPKNNFQMNYGNMSKN